MPLTVTYARTGVNPELLTGTDIRSEALVGLRKPDSRSMSVSMSIRRSQPGKGWLTKGLADPLSLNANVTTGRALTELSEAQSTSYAFNANYQLLLRRKGIRLPLGGIAKALPGFMRRGELGKGLDQADLSLLPTRVTLTQRPHPERGELDRVPIPGGPKRRRQLSSDRSRLPISGAMPRGSRGSRSGC